MSSCPCLLALWIIIGGVAGGIIAGYKGRNTVLGFLYGALAGPFFVWFDLLDKPRGMRNCPYCAESIKRQAAVCRYCRKEVPPVSPHAPQ